MLESHPGPVNSECLRVKPRHRYLSSSLLESNLGDSTRQSALRTTPWVDNGIILVVLFLGKSREL